MIVIAFHLHGWLRWGQCAEHSLKLHLPQELKRVIDGLDKTQQIFLRADKSLSYETVVNVLGLIQTVGGLEVGLVTDDSPEKPEVAPE